MDSRSYLQVPGWETTLDRLGGSCGDANNSPWKLDKGNDKYTAAIELSNKCREFYQTRLEAANKRKSKWQESSLGQHDCIDASFLSSSSSLSSDCDNEKVSRNKQQRRRVDQAMNTLRTEMVSLLDQDLSLMKQLLTLNETIEDLKWQRQYYSYNTSWASFSTSKILETSVSDTEMYDSEEDFTNAQQTCNSVQTAQVTGSTWYNSRNVRKNSRELHHTSVDSVCLKAEGESSTNTSTYSTETTNLQPLYKETRFREPSSMFISDNHKISNGQITVHHERSESSFDSGIHDVISGDELTWSS